MSRKFIIAAIAAAFATPAMAQANNTSPTQTASAPTGTSLVKCPIVFDGRVPSTAALADFDTAGGGGFNPFNPDFVKGEGLKFSELLVLPNVSTSRFDQENNGRAVEVTVSDKSIFLGFQFGFRRAELLFANDPGDTSPANSGVKTVHFSVLQDPVRAFNFSHEYLNVFHETSDNSAAQFTFQTGTLLGQPELPAETWKILDKKNEQIFSAPMSATAWQNFAITLNHDASTLDVYFSEGSDPLVNVVSALPADTTGNGSFHFGLLKKPTGTDDVVNSGFQQANVNEGLIYGGIFVEDSAGGCVSL